MTLEESKEVSDRIEKVEGLSFLINERDEPFLRGGVKVDLIQSKLFGTGLQVMPLYGPSSSC
jgi:hypothetical protein